MLLRTRKPKSLIAAMIPVGLAAGMAMLPMQNATAGYLIDSSGNVVTTGYGGCWEGIWPKPDNIPECGDKAPESAPGDADGDGVTDDKDKCPGTPRGVKVDANGCPLDSDGDGVTDDKDQCPGTPRGAKVNSVGCEIVGNITINLVNDEFDFDSAALKPEMQSALDEVVSRINASKGKESLAIIGYTDSTGPEAYNQGLSERRAKAVADYLRSKGVDAEMVVSGMGESNPIADNGTREGRSKNRRVEIETR